MYEDAVNAEVGTGEDDDPLLDEHHCKELVEKKYRLRNLITAMSLVGVAMVAEMIYIDSYSQWLYLRFTEQVLGANYSNLNVSATKHPCLQTNLSNDDHKYSAQLNEAQKLASNFNSWTLLICLIPSVFTNILFGSYMDLIGRKLFFIVPVTGMLTKMVISWAVCYWHLNLYLLFLAYFLQGTCGSLWTLFMAIYVYTADNTDEHKSRSVEMVLVDCVSNVFSSLSHVAVGYSIQSIGYMWPMAAASLLCFCGLLGCIFLLRETLPRRRDAPCFHLTKGLRSVFSFYFTKSAHPEHKRKDFIIMITVFILYSFAVGPSLRTLYLLNEPFCWNSKKIGDVLTITGILKGFITLVVMKVLKLIVSDESVLVITLAFSVGHMLTFSLSYADWMIYLGLSLSLMQGAPLSIIRAIMSRMIPLTKRGSLFASIAVMEAVFISVSGIALNAVYAETVHIWKGLAYLLMSIFLLLGTFTMTCFIFMKKRRKSGMVQNAIINKRDA